MGYEPKLRDTLLTDAGRHTFLAVGDGQGTLVYTRAILSSQKMRNAQGVELSDEDIRAITGLSDGLKEGKLQLTPIIDNTISVIADFSNENQPEDIFFSTIGWYARIDTFDSSGRRTQGPEKLIAITPTVKDSEALAAGSPDHRSTQVISAELDMALSNAAKVDMTVNQVGYVTRAELNIWQTQIKDDLNAKLNAIDFSKIKFRKQYLNAQGQTADATWSAHRNSDGTYTIDLYNDDWTASKVHDLLDQIGSKADKNDTYTKQEVDSRVAGAGKINTVEGMPPDSSGNVELSAKFYLKGDVDRQVADLNQQISDLKSQNTNKSTQINNLSSQITSLNNKLNDLTNRVVFLEQNAVIGKRFSRAQAIEAANWENQHPNYLGIVEDA